MVTRIIAIIGVTVVIVGLLYHQIAGTQFHFLTQHYSWGIVIAIIGAFILFIALVLYIGSRLLSR